VSFRELSHPTHRHHQSSLNGWPCLAHAILVWLLHDAAFLPAILAVEFIPVALLQVLFCVLPMFIEASKGHHPCSLSFRSDLHFELFHL